MKLKDIETIINSEIGWCVENPDGVDKEYRKGFIAGLRQAKRLIKEFEKTIKQRIKSFKGNKMTTFTYEYLPTMEAVREEIRKCEGHHTQQVAYSTFHDALTQVCFGCKKIRSSLSKEK